MTTERPHATLGRLYADLQREKHQRELLNRATLELARTLRLEEILPLLIGFLGELIDFAAVGIYLYQRRSGLLEWFYGHGYPEGSEEQLRLKLGQGAVGWTAAHRQAVIIPDVRRDPRYLTARPATLSEMIAPLIVEDELVGILNLESDELNAFRERDLELLTAFGHHCAVAIQRTWLHQETIEKRRLEEEIGIARRIQMRLLPSDHPEFPGYDVAAFNHPSQEVSGDLYDFIDVAPGQLGILIGDVAGKGVPAGLLMASFRASVRAEVRNNYAIGLILAKVNRLMCESVEETDFVTAVYGVLDGDRRRFTYCNAGHNPPLLARATGAHEWLHEGGTVLGSFMDADYREAFVDLAPGDRVVFYTDGITEARRADGEMFGGERIAACIDAVPQTAPARHVCAALLEAVRTHTGSPVAEDDLTAIVLQPRDSHRSGR